MLTEVESQWDNQYAQGVSNHLTLLDQISQFRKGGEPVCIVTFNYDTLVERELTQWARNIEHLSDYVAHDDFKLFKLHGSINWLRQIRLPNVRANMNDVGSVTRELIARASQIDFTDKFVLSSNNSTLANSADLYFPAIAIPVDIKQQFECPIAHVEMLQNLLPLTTKILAIGWRATEAHFFRLLLPQLRSPIHVMACSGTTELAKMTLAPFRNAPTGGTFDVVAGGFSQMIVGREIDSFLRKL